MRKLNLLLLFIIALCAAKLNAGSAGTTGLNFLKIEPTARASASAGAFCAVADDAGAVYYNPAGLSLQRYKQFSFTHLNYIENIKYQFLSYVHPIDSAQTFAGSVYYLSVNDIPSYDNSGTLLDEKLKVYDLALGLSYSRKLYGVNSGVTFKYIKESLAGISANTLAFDAGFMYGLERAGLPRTKTAFVVQNIGTKIKFIEKEDPIPLVYRVGVSHKMLRDALTISSDINFPNDNKYFVNLGLDYVLTDWVSLRCGYKHRSSDKEFDVQPSFTGGLGIGNDDIRIDYAFAPYSGFGSTHRLGLSYRFGKAYALDVMEQRINKHLELADNHYKNNNIIPAYNEYQNVLLLDPLNDSANKRISLIKSELDSAKVNLYLNDADELIIKGEILKARELLTDCSDLIPDNMEIKDKLSSINTILKEEKGKRADTMFEQGLEFFNDEKYNDAVSLWEKILIIDPNHEKAKEHIQIAEQEITKIEEEKRKSELKERKEKAQSFYKKGLSHINKDEWQKAYDLFNEACNLDPRNKDAARELKTAKEKLAEQHYINAINNYDKGLLDSAVKNLKEAVRVTPKEEYKNKLSSIESELKDTNKNMAEDLSREGLKEYGAGNLKKAVDIWEKALKLDPDNKKIENNLNRAKEELKNQ